MSYILEVLLINMHLDLEMQQDMIDLRNEIAKIIGINIQSSPSAIKYDLLESVKEDGYTRELIEYNSYGDKVKAYLLIPDIQGKWNIKRVLAELAMI